MRYDEKTKIISISAKELVFTARRGICTNLPLDLDEPEKVGILPSIYNKLTINEEKISLSYSLKVDGFNAKIDTDALVTKKGELHFIVAVDTLPKRPKKEVVAQARGEAFIAGYIFAENEGYEDVTLTYTYINPTTEDQNFTSEKIGKKKLKSFFEKCVMSIKVYARPEIERVTERIPSMRSAKFPYENARDGQSEMLHAVYKNIARGGRLYVAAPTGTGKTVSTLFPAIRALGKKKCDKIFYFTSKTTTAIAANECLSLLSENGAKIRSIQIYAKEKICQNGTLCRKGRDLCANTKFNKLANAVLELYDTGGTVIQKQTVNDIAKKYSVCPYELSLSYAELCDVVICDINYLFDPSVYIRRFFSEGGNYAFLIDEAHNLPDRAREMYSAEISEEELVSPSLDPIFPEHDEIRNIAKIASDKFYEALYPYLKEELVHDDEGIIEGAAHLKDIPTALYEIFAELTESIEMQIYRTIIAKDEEKELRLHLLNDYYYRVKKFHTAISNFDGGYELFLFYENRRIRAKCFCIDPSKEISKHLDKGSAAIFFSGTLTPLYYYKSVLGGDGSSEELEVDSPFDPSQLSVNIMDKISTRLSTRENTLLAVCKAIAATVSAKRGHYMIFSPSFAYSEALAMQFAAKYPKIKILRQKKNMTQSEKDSFLDEFKKEENSYLIAFCVMGGIYSEGIDLAGDSLIGAVVVGIGIPALSYEREAISAYYNDKYEEGKQFAYIYPGINRVLQAAGRVVRREDDKGVVVLIDDRFDDPVYKDVIPSLWKGMKFISDPKELRAELDLFWSDDNHV